MPRLSWLRPGLGVKRWGLLVAGGLLCVALGTSQVLTVRRLSWVINHLRALDWALIGLGMALMAMGIGSLIESLALALAPEHKGELTEVLFRNRIRLRGPRFVVIGGGTGLSVLLKGLKAFTTNLTAIVTVSDDGGSSGRLRRDMSVLPPGDIRNCLVALARNEEHLAKLFQYRFEKGELSGHTAGNLLIAALTEMTGDFLTAIKVSSDVLAITGEVLPSTCANVALRATFEDGTRLEGETRISRAGKKIQTIELVPSPVEPPAAVLDRIRDAECIVLGPGSLYTSIIPNLLVPGIAQAINASYAPVVLVANLMTQPGETDRFSLSDHVRALTEHTALTRLDVILVNSSPIDPKRLARYRGARAEPVSAEPAELESQNIGVQACDLLAETNLIRHDHAKLAVAVMEILERRLASRVRVLKARSR